MESFLSSINFASVSSVLAVAIGGWLTLKGKREDISSENLHHLIEGMAARIEALDKKVKELEAKVESNRDLIWELKRGLQNALDYLIDWEQWAVRRVGQPPKPDLSEIRDLLRPRPRVPPKKEE